MNRFWVFAAVLVGCFEPVEVGSHDAGQDGGTNACTVGQDQTCNELTTMSALAGTCTTNGCGCNSGFEKGPSGRCRPIGSCPTAPQQPGGSCSANGLVCAYGYAPIECGGRTVRCQGSVWVEVEHADPQLSCHADGGSDAGTCPTTAPTCLMGTVGGLCGDAVAVPNCTNGAWHCPAGTIESTQCACVGSRPGCTCTASGWMCADAGSVCSRTGLDQACNELQVMASFAGTCSNGRCVCNTGFEPSPSGRCQPLGAICTDRVATSCNDSPTDPSTVNTCIIGHCLCGAGYELSPTTGKCSALQTPTGCTVGMDQTCNANPLISALTGVCVGGSCQCQTGFVLNSGGKCTASSLGYCIVTTSPGTCTLQGLDGGVTSGGMCGNQAISAGCSCEPGTPPVPRCFGACPPTVGRTCITTNCGSVSCQPPLRCTALNTCAF